jgi:hypothetical protein
MGVATCRYISTGQIRLQLQVRSNPLVLFAIFRYPRQGTALVPGDLNPFTLRRVYDFFDDAVASIAVRQVQFINANLWVL